MSEPTNKKVETKFYPSKICVTCNNKIIDGTEFEKILKHFEQGHQVIDDNRKGIELINGPMPMQKKAEPTYLEYAKLVLSKCSILTLEDTNEVLYYDNGTYLSNGVNKIKKLLLQINPDLRIHQIKEIVEKIKQMTPTPRTNFDVDEFEICVRNGVINVKTGQFTEHNPDKLFRVSIPVTFDPKVRSTKFVEFLHTVLPLPMDYIDQLEAFSTCLIKNSPKLETLFFETGNGDNGKSTFFKIINWFVGKDNYSTISIHEFIRNRFAIAGLEGKMINTFPDLESDALDNFGLVKALVSGDEIDAELKYENLHSFVNRAKMFFSANELPEIREKTFATFKRIRVTEWNQIFVKPEHYKNLKLKLAEKYPKLSDATLENELADDGIHLMNKQFVNDILNDEVEKSGILNLLLITVRHLIRRDGFFNEYSIEYVKDKWLRNSTVIESFVKECFTLDPTAYVIKFEVFQLFLNYCKAIGKPAKNNNVFHPRFQELIQGLEVGRKRIKGQETRVYIGIKWNKANPFVRKFIQRSKDETDESSNIENHITNFNSLKIN